MINELYRVLNVLLIALLCLFCAALQSVALKMPMLAWLELDLLLLIAIYISLHRVFFEGAILIILIGRIAELHSGAPAGILVACYLAVFLALVFTNEMFLVASSFSSVILAVAGGLVWKIAFLVFAQRYGILNNTWRSSLEYLLPFLLSLGVFAKPVFEFIRRIDQWTKMDGDSEARQLTGEEF
jgi:hypothetical protein